MTEQTNLKAKAGDLLFFTSGEYSDYSINGHFVALENITVEHFAAAKADAEEKYRISEEAQDAWKREGGEPYPLRVNRQEAFIAALIRAGLLVSLAVTEHHIGSYDEINI